MLPLFQDLHQLQYGLVISVQLFLTFNETDLLVREQHKLVQSLLVDVTVLLQFSVAFLKLLPELLRGCGL